MEKQKIKSIYLIITFAILLYFSVENLEMVSSGVGFLFSVIKPIVYGGIIAFIFNLPMKGLESFLSKKIKKGQRAIAYFITLTVFLIFFTMLVAIVVPQVILSLTQIIESAEGIYNQLPAIFENLQKAIPELNQLLDLELSELLSDFTSYIESLALSMVNGITSFVVSLFDGVVNFGVAFIFSIYLLFSKEKVYDAIKNLLYSAFKKEKIDKLYKLSDLTNKSFSNFITGQVTEAIIVGVIFLIVLAVLNFEYAVLISTILSVGSLIPIFGSFIGCVIAVFFLATVNLSQAFWFVILFLIIQQLEGNLIYPYVVGNKVGIPAILVFISVVIGGNLLGLVGMITFIPITGVVYTLLKEFVEKKNPKPILEENNE